MPDTPARGKTPAQRHMDIEPAPNPLAELISRPAKNTQEITGVVPDIEQAPHVAAIDAAPVVDLNAAIDRATRRLSGG